MKPEKTENRAFFFEQALPRCVINAGRYEAELLNWGRMAPHYWHNQNHAHSFFELCFVCQGSGRYTLSGQRKNVTRGDLLIAHPGEEHCLHADEKEPLGIYCASFGVYSGAVEAVGPHAELSRMVAKFLESGVRVVRAPKLEGICQMISGEVLEQEAGFELSLTGLFTKFFFSVVNACSGGTHALRATPAHRAHPQDLRLRQAVIHIENNFQSPLQVSDIATCLCISQRQANRMFQQSFGMPVMRYIQTYRLKMAKQMLDNTSRPIKEIAWACGYPNERNFMTLFRRHAGLTANQFRHARNNRT
jgi:AraC-like DNA-binding protein/mannose-6-phosphate isomerase-like protein (cupin superfamily)